MWANEADVFNQMRAYGLAVDGVSVRVNTPHPVRFGKAKKMWCHEAFLGFIKS